MTDAPIAPFFSRRVFAAGLSYLAFGLFAPVPALVSIVLAILPLGAERRQRLTRLMIQCLCRIFVELMQLFGLYRYRVVREYRGSSAGKIIVANHPMLLDAVFIMAFIPNICCIAKPALAKNFFTRATLRHAGFLVAGEPDLLDQMVLSLERGESVLVFPEGTRNTSDLELNFRRGAANLAVLSDCEVLPVVMECRPRALQKHQSWYQIPAELVQICMTICPPISSASCVDTNSPRTLQYRAFTEVMVNFFRTRLSALATNSGTIAFGKS
jgi:1-acyl-sn-glycerol-3-phosphate acyltransferase